MDAIQIPAQPTLPGGGRALRAPPRRQPGCIAPPLVGLVMLRLAQLNGCEQCARRHHLQLQHQGMRAALIAAVAPWRSSLLFSAPERAALDWAEALAVPQRAANIARTYAALRAHLQDNGIALCAVLPLIAAARCCTPAPAPR